MASSVPDLDALAQQLASYTIMPTSKIQISQMAHRLRIFTAWFGSDLATALARLRGQRIVELGCGQGDMTVALAYAAHGGVSSAGRGQSSEEDAKVTVRAVDPAPLTYGSPFNLGQAQAHLSASPIGSAIEWVQSDPVELLQQQGGLNADVVVLAHSLFYFPSETYTAQCLAALRRAAVTGDAAPTRLLLAEWGMRASSGAARAHVLAVEAQALQRNAEANVRTVLAPAELTRLAREAGWGLEREEWMVRPPVDDGKWEVAEARQVAKKPGCAAEVAAAVEEMETCIRSNGGQIECMDVWTGVFVPI